MSTYEMRLGSVLLLMQIILDELRKDAKRKNRDIQDKISPEEI
jgi:hypothetical protein